MNRSVRCSTYSQSAPGFAGGFLFDEHDRLINAAKNPRQSRGLSGLINEANAGASSAAVRR
jgi:hypothetical protein